MKSFSQLIESNTRRFRPEPAQETPQETPMQRLTTDVGLHLTQQREFVTRAFLPWLDNLILGAELVENASITNQPVMLVNHGKVMALKELRATLLSLSGQP